MPKLASCGTRSGYNRHLRLKEAVCEDCKSAQRKYDRDRFYQNPDLKRFRNKIHSNPEKKRASWRRRQAKKLNNGYEFYSDTDVINIYGTNCHLCEQPIDMNASRRSGIGENWEFGLHIDHIVPISSGGPDTLENVRPAHGICNIRKGNRV